ncbi:hypothetical protein MAPG_07447 [Magnaporthiopsis poae ATCC 64411]|uniref:Uncharacterized protein n=1 Tax=Magnaporthiopsis poae (strain ATCC 64411 / 73-15) TaxID=644358 RepID=A0A0C4E4P8_MAGP6|nr:hypothetical protein MAPG_07447 [Magnaporthiopsis poae ATCC 64411]
MHLYVGIKQHLKRPNTWWMFWPCHSDQTLCAQLEQFVDRGGGLVTQPPPTRGPSCVENTGEQQHSHGVSLPKPDDVYASLHGADPQPRPSGGHYLPNIWDPSHTTRQLSGVDDLDLWGVFAMYQGRQGKGAKGLPWVGRVLMSDGKVWARSRSSVISTSLPWYR